MSGMKRMLDEIRDDGVEAFHEGFPREANPYAGEPVKCEYWVEGWDYAQDQEIIGRKPQSDEELEVMFEYHFGTPA